MLRMSSRGRTAGFICIIHWIKQINRMINNRNDNKETYNPFVSLSREEIFAQLEYSRKRADEGQVIPAHQAAALVREKFGL